MTYKIYVRDKSLTLIGEIDDFKSLNLVCRFNGVGTWLIDLPADSDMALALTQPQAGIIVVRDGLTLLSGPRLKPYRKWNKDENILTVSGVCDNVWLQRRLALPVVTGPPYSGSEYDVRSGVAETVMRQYVDYNAGPNANTERQVTGLTLAADGAIGSSITGRARFNVLLEFLQSLAIAGGDLGFKIAQAGSGLEFQVYQPTDKTATAVFSAGLGNLEGFEYSEEDAELNYVYCGGGGEGTSRTFAEKGDSTSIIDDGRIEFFKDQRNTTDPTELTQAIDEELAQKAEKTSLGISPIDTQAVSFMTDYQLGDKVTVIVDDTSIQDVVREVSISITNEGEVIKPLIGVPGSIRPEVSNVFRQLRELKARINNLERR